MKTAIVIGATGLTGSHLVDFLLKDERFNKVVIFVRRPTHKYNSKLEEHVINFDHPNEWKHLVKGHVLFSALGTTIKKAGSKEVQYKVDYTYQYQFAKAASQNGVPVYVLVSSVSADPNSRIFYTKMKGELERDVKNLSFQQIHILQPGQLEGERDEERSLEKVSLKLTKALNAIGLLKQYKPIHGRIVAKKMVTAAFSQLPGIHIYKLNEVFNVQDN